MTRHRPSEERRRQILEATLQCLLDGGFHTTTVERIAQQAGLSKGAVYFHFENKRALLFALVDEEFARAEVVIDEALAATEVPILAGAQAFVDFLGSQGDPRHKFLLLAGEMAVQDAELRERMVTQHQRLLARITELVRRWTEAAGIPMADPEMAAIMLKALADGLQATWALGVHFDAGRLLRAVMGVLPHVIGGLFPDGDEPTPTESAPTAPTEPEQQATEPEQQG